MNIFVNEQELQPRANERNIVGQQIPILLDVTCCVLLHTLLYIAACCWELLKLVKLLSTCKRAQQLPTTMLRPFVSSEKFDRCQILGNSYQQHATTCNNRQQGVQTDLTCNIQQCGELLANNVASVCKRL